MNSARPVILEGDVLTLEFSEQMWVDRFKENPTSGKAVFEDLREAILGALGVRLRFVPRLVTFTGQNPTAPIKPVAPAEPVEPVAPAPTEHVVAEPVTTESAERRGESVIREVLGATLIANIDDASTPQARSTPADDTPAIFDVDPTPREGEE